MDELQSLIIQNECRTLTILYCRHLDHLDPDAFAGLYTEDATYKPAAEPVPLVGRPAILAWAHRYPKHRLGRHCAINQIVTVVDEDHAIGSSYAVVFREPDPQEGLLSSRVTPRSVVEYTDRYRRTSQGWRFSHRSYQLNFMQAEEARRPIG